MISATRENLDRLVSLQQLESRLRRIHRELAGVDGQIAQLEQGISQFAAAVAQAEQRVAQLQQQYRAWEREVQQNNDRILKSEAKLRSVKTNKEYQAGLKEIDDIKALNAGIEDRMLDCLEQIEAAEADLEAARREQAAEMQRLTAEKQTIIVEAEQRRAQAAQIEAELETLRGKIPADLLAVFKRVQATKSDAVAIARVDNAVCEGCHLNIPPQLFNELHREDSLKMCPNCERIIYWQPTGERPE